MLLMLIVLLWLLSLSLRITSSGISTLKKVYDRVNKDSDKKDVYRIANNAIGSVSSSAVGVLIKALDLIRYLFTAMLPFVLVIDVLVWVLIVSAGGGYLLLLSDGLPMSDISTNTSNSSSENMGTGKSKVLLIGDSRTVQLGMTVFNLEYVMDEGNAMVVSETSTGDFIYGKGSMGIKWMKDRESDIDSKVDENTAVVVNMGTNDCYNGSIYEDYIDYLNKKAEDWVSKGADVYFASTNPVNDISAAKNGYALKDSHVVAFNEKVKNGLSDNIKYIDTYSEVKSLVIDNNETQDGIHYNKVVYENIKNVIWGMVKGSYSNSDELGKAVIAEAEKYVGKLDYVWGGSDLKTGADCSGFVCALYDKCGYSDIWDYRTTDAMMNIGEKVNSIKDAQAGDLLLYDGHVALYDGKGGRIHAVQPGEKVRHDDYVDDYIAIRRIKP